MAKWKEVTNHGVKDPNIFQDSTTRFAALLARADRITSDGKFKALPADNQKRVLSDYYDRFVAPGYTSLGYQAPDKDLWLREMPKETGKLDSRSFFSSTNMRQAQLESAGIKTGAESLFKGMFYGGVWLGKQESYAALGLSHFFGATGGKVYDQQKNYIEMQDKKNKETIDKASLGLFDSNNFWLQTHPSKNWTDKLETSIGEQVIQLPLYEAIGAGRLAIAGKAGLNLSTTLGTSKLGQFVGRRIAEGADAYVGAMLQNKDQSSRFGDMAAFMGFGSTLEGLGAALKLPSRFLIKQFTSRMAAMGGHSLMEAASDAADEELSKGILGWSNDGKRISIHSEDGERGHIAVGDEKYPYSSKDMQQHLINGFIRDHHINDPVHATIINAEKMTLSALSIDKFGKFWEELNDGEKQVLRISRNQITKEAINEAAIHNPDIAAKQTAHELQADVKGNPVLAQRIAQAEKASGIKVSDAVTAAEQDKVSQESGVKQSQGTIEKALRKPKEAPKASPITQEAKEQEPRKFAQMKTNFIAYYKNNSSSSKTMGSLGKEIKDMDSEEFVHSIMEQIGNNFKFENSEHALLWANSFRNELPKPFQKRLIEELHDINPKETVAKWDEQSKNLGMHMQELAYTGRLFSQGNIFRSTKVEDWTTKTGWQLQLRDELETRELQVLKKVMQRYPKAYKQAVTITKQMQAMRREAVNVDQYANMTDTIREYKLKALKERLGIK